MRPCFLFLFLVTGHFVQAQKQVSDLLGAQRATCDSLMCIQYGPEMFEKYFVFDSGSGGYFGYGFNTWNEVVEADSASYFFIWYLFRYPGALTDSFVNYEFYSHNNSRPTRGAYGGKCSTRKIKIKPPHMDSITRAVLNHPLSECTVRMHDFIDFNDSLYSTLDSTHVFLEAGYDDIRYFGWKKRKYELHRRTLVIDAFTGAIVGDSILHAKGRIDDGPYVCGAGG